MKESIVAFLRQAYPFLLAVGLWRLSHPFWNPAGILAIIPIFFCSFIKPINWFPLFSVLMCVVIDYKFETICFWLAMYCLFYAVNGFQHIVDLTRMDNDGIAAFAIFFGLGVVIQILTNFTGINILRGIWIFLWAGAIYLPITISIKRIYK